MSTRGIKIAAILLLLGSVLMLQGAAMSGSSALALQAPSTPSPRQPQPPIEPTQPALPEALSSADWRLIRQVASANDIPVEQLSLVYSEVITLPLTGASLTYGKVVDRSTGKAYAVALDQNGSVVDDNALRQAEKQAMQARYGKLHPSLAKSIEGLLSGDRVRVSIWLKMGALDASMERIAPEEAKSLSPEEMRQRKSVALQRAAQIHQQVESPLLELLPSLGGQLISAAETAPIVLAEVPVQAIQQIAAQPYVDTIDLLVEGAPEGDGDNRDEEKAEPGGFELGSARPASKANIVEARGITGADVFAAVVEGDSIEFDNPYLVDGACGPNTACATIDEHPTTVGGIIASTHSTSRGIAPGIGNHLLSANGGGWALSNHQAATTWAMDQGASVLNNSYLIEADGVLHNSDRWMDYIVRQYADLEVKSAGNRGEGDDYVTSPGLGFNTLTVGAVEDKNTASWDDDAMAEFTSWVEPVNREKPEVAAVGCGEWITGSGGAPGIISTGIASPWIYDQGCGTSYSAPIVAGGGALLIDRNSSLETWPEAEKAILIATALHNVEGSSVKSELDGAGAVDLAAADTLAANGWWRGHLLSGSAFNSSGDYTSMTVYLYPGEPVRAALAYDSNPSADYTNDPLEGDLDLYMYDPSGTYVAGAGGLDSWEILQFTPTVEGNYSVVIHNFGGSLTTSESTYVGVAVWPGHYVLQPYEAQVRDQPSGAWNQDSGDDYRFTRGSWWNAVGLWSPSGADYDLYLFNKSVYGDPADHSRLAASLGTGPVDIVALDGNYAPSGDYYTTISRYSGTGNYSTQHATWSGDLGSGTHGPYDANGESLRVWDLYTAAAQPLYVCVVPTGGNADLGVLLFDSDSTQPSTWYRGRFNAAAGADNTGAGGKEYLTYTSFDGDYKGLVVYNKSGASEYNIVVGNQPVAPCASLNDPLFTTDDNENNAQTGSPDGDMDVYVFNNNSIHPIEFTIDVPNASGISTAKLMLLVWDVDDESGEVDEVYFNGHFAGRLTGADGAWSTTTLNLDPAWVTTGKNLVQIYVDLTNTGTWAATVDWGQLYIGQSEPASIRAVRLGQAFYPPGSNAHVTVEVDTTLPWQEVRTQVNLLNSSGTILDTKEVLHEVTGTANDPVSVDLAIPPCAPTGTYKVQVLVYNLADYHLQDTSQMPLPVTWQMTFTSVASQDGWVLESGEFTSLGGTMNAAGTVLSVGDYTADRQYRSILSFNTAGLPDAAVLTRVTLKIRSAGVVGTNPFSTHGNLLVDVRKGAFASYAALQVQDFQAAASKTSVMTITSNPVGGWYSKAMGAAGGVYVNKTGVTQFRLRFVKDDNDDLGADYIKFHSGNSTSASYRPQLIIQYALACSAP